MAVLLPSFTKYKSDQLKAWPGLTPRALRILASGQNPVKAAWNKLAPTKVVNHNQLGLCNWDRDKLSSINAPARAKTTRSRDMGFTFLVNVILI